MIDHVLNRDSVLGMAHQLIEKGDAARELSPEDAAELAAALKALETAIGGQPPLGDAVDPESRKTFIPTDAALSLLQAYYEQDLDDDPADLVAPIAAPAGPLADQELSSEGVAEGWGDFDGKDPKWVIAFLKELAHHLDERRAFKLPDSPPRPARLEDDARVILVGDWGTGGEIADAVSARVRDELASAGDRQTHVIHLGDVYYAGTRWEAEHRFLPHWPVHEHEGGDHHSWCLNANHDMYAAGEGLFEVILADPRFAAQVTADGRPTTEFLLEGDHWQILGLDSAWKLLGYDPDDLRGHAGHLGDEQVAWLDSVAGPRRGSSVLLSHHQPFTRARRGSDGIETVGNLLSQTTGVRGGDGLKAWFWGHEHRCMTYGSRDGIEYPACVGHGAIPVPAKASLAEPPEWELTASYTDRDDDEWRMSGFAVLDFEPDAFVVRYVDHHGELSRPADRVSRG
jgi:hypothetical protein